MFARPLTRRSRLLATATLIAATGTTMLVPATAFAADAPPAAVAPAAAAPAAKADENAAKPLAATLETAPGQAPITRGGEGAAMKLTVTNNSDEEQQYHPTVSVAPVGTPTNSLNWIEFSAKEISGPETYGLRGFGSNGFTGYVLPKNGMTSRTFTVPAHTTYSWAVTVQVRAALPADNTAVKVTLQNDRDNSTNSAPINLPIAAPTGALVQRFTSSGTTVSFKKPFETDLVLTNNGAAITAPITPTLKFPDTRVPLKLDVQQPDGTWVAVPGSGNVWQLPPVAGGLGKGESHHYKARLSLGDVTGPGTSFSTWMSLLPDTDQGPIDIISKELVEVDTYRATPTPQPTPTETTPAPTATPTATATSTPVATPTTAPAAVPVTTPTTTPTATVPAGTKVVAAAYSGNQAATTTATKAVDATAPTSTTLASTGAGNSGAMFGTAGALVLLGAGSVFYAKRRRTQAQD
ncbi:LPXTG cell wall anchor domain-containing protein [Kitasatospora misakiensis]|uniref:LPXTG cell wall anchor domain-containing protein n=1 Tax=Kitasatospora misakiensis TaxID=67330 RepID=A0ABW0XBF1_9ACTN